MTFQDAEKAEQVLANKDLAIEGKVVDIKRAISRTEMAKVSAPHSIQPPLRFL